MILSRLRQSQLREHGWDDPGPIFATRIGALSQTLGTLRMLSYILPRLRWTRITLPGRSTTDDP